MTTLLDDVEPPVREPDHVPVRAQLEADPRVQASARDASSMVRIDSINDVALIGRLGSWAGERAAQRPSAWKIGSLSRPSP